MLVEQNFA